MKNAGKSIVRILEIRLRNYKNISKGSMKVGDISSVENGLADIRGIYGQNGSGKTAIISAVGLIKRLFMGQALPEDISEYIMYGEDELEVELLFYVKNDSKEYKVEYNLVVEKKDKDSYIKKESLRYWDRVNTEDKWNTVKSLMINEYNNNDLIPQNRNSQVTEMYKEKNDFIVYKKIKFNEKRSLFFSDEFVDLVNRNLENDDIGIEYEVLDILKFYLYFDLFVIDNSDIALSDANILLPINIKNRSGSSGVLPVGLKNPVYLPRTAIDDMKSFFNSSNKVLNEIIPGLTIEVREIGAQISETGEEEVLVELLSSKNGVKIPIRYESDGIKKIVAVIHLLIAMFNNNYITVLIDELDSGIFEYLLGEILEILESRGKGQLIFTSHNLRPLEVSDKNNLVFTSTNPSNRYIRLKNVKTNNNIRDMYYRDLVLGGQEEKVYDSTNSAKIARAFRKAGE